jgi:hypothetical protein
MHGEPDDDLAVRTGSRQDAVFVVVEIAATNGEIVPFLADRLGERKTREKSPRG